MSNEMTKKTSLILANQDLISTRTSTENLSRRKRENGIYEKSHGKKQIAKLSKTCNLINDKLVKSDFDVSSNSAHKIEIKGCFAKPVTASDWYKYLRENVNNSVWKSLKLMLLDEVKENKSSLQLIVESSSTYYVEAIASKCKEEKLYNLLYQNLQKASQDFYLSPMKKNLYIKSEISFSYIKQKQQINASKESQASFSLKFQKKQEEKYELTQTSLGFPCKTNKKLRLKCLNESFEIMSIKLKKNYLIPTCSKLNLERSLGIASLKVEYNWFSMTAVVKLHEINRANEFMLPKSIRNLVLVTMSTDELSIVRQSHQLMIEKIISIIFASQFRGMKSDLLVFTTSNLQIRSSYKNSFKLLEQSIQENLIDNDKEMIGGTLKTILKSKSTAMKSRSSRILRHVRFHDNTDLRPSIIRCLSQDDKKETFISSLFLDVLCICCYSCVKVFDTEDHSNVCTSRIGTWKSYDLYFSTKIKEVQEMSMEESQKIYLQDMLLKCINSFDIQKMKEVSFYLLEEVTPKIIKKKSKKTITELHQLITLKIEKIISILKILERPESKKIPLKKIAGKSSIEQDQTTPKISFNSLRKAKRSQVKNFLIIYH